MSQFALEETMGGEKMEFSPEELETVGKIIEAHRNKPGSLITVLEEIQEHIGYLPKSILKQVATGLRLPQSEVFGVVTFYSFFTMTPRGRHTIRCCLGTACYVRGGNKNLQKLSDILHVKAGETTEDRRFSLETVRCLGACGLAPTMTVDNETFPRVKPTNVGELLKEYP